MPTHVRSHSRPAAPGPWLTPGTALVCPICLAPAPPPQPIARVNALVTPPARGDAALCRCLGCGFWWVSPAPDTAALEAAYRVLDASHWAPAPPGDPRGYAHKVACVQRHVSGGRALDVGCFHGELLTALPAGFERHGVELCAAAAQVARDRGVQVVEGSALDAPLPGRFEAVFCMDTIEHVVDQQALAARLAAWTAPGGVLVIETGDTSSWPARVLGGRWSYVGLHEHVCAHSTRSLTTLMGQHGMVLRHLERRTHTRASPAQHARRAAIGAAFVALGAVAALGAPVRQRLARWVNRPAPMVGGPDHQLAIFAHAGGEGAR